MFVESNGLGYFVPGNIDSTKAAAIFATRRGGVSRGAGVGSLNFGSFSGKYDTPENVRKNYETVALELGFSVNNIIHATQRHTADILTADESLRGCGLPLPGDYIFDAMVTNVPGIVLTARSADCVPILFYDGGNRAVGAAHCGWRGTALGLQIKTARKMRELYGTDLRKLKAAVGPCISKCCYEVSADVYESFADSLGSEINRFFESKSLGAEQKYMCDLKAVNKFLLTRELDESNIEISENCTCCEPDLFYSHRRDGENRGTHAAFISIRENI